MKRLLVFLTISIAFGTAKPFTAYTQDSQQEPQIGKLYKLRAGFPAAASPKDLEYAITMWKGDEVAFMKLVKQNRATLTH